MLTCSKVATSPASRYIPSMTRGHHLRRLGFVAFHAVFLSLTVAPAAGATLTGTVSTSGAMPAPIHDARVILFDAGLSIFLETRTDAQGGFRIDAPAGTYRLGSSKRGLTYVEVPVMLSSAPAQQNVSLGIETELGAWAMIGDTSPEQFGGSNSGSLLADGTLLFCHDTRDPIRFNPVTLAKTLAADSGDYQGCSAITLLGTGELIFIGGQKSSDFRDSTARVKTFNTWTGAWSLQPSLNQERWYPALARLADGGLLVCGGGQRPNAQRTDSCERWAPATRLWTLTSPMSQPSEYSPMTLMHTGEVLKTWFPPELYDPASGGWRPTGTTVQQADRAAAFPDHCDHSLVIQRDGSAVVVGILPAAASPAPVMAEHYDACAETWSLGGSGVVARSRPEAVPLPDGRVFVAGGRLEVTAPGVFTNPEGYVRLADIYDPSTRSWRPVAAMRVAREYHATSVLLPDGRVLVTAGAGSVGSPSSDMGIDAFSPPYLFRGPRPRIVALSTTTLKNGETLTIDVSSAPEATSVVLLGSQATTHYVDGAVPRRLALAFSQNGNQVTARVPTSPVAAPQGHYILFVMVDDVPSDGRLVRIDPALSAAPPDQIGDALRAVTADSDLVLEWRHGPLNPSRYNVYKATIASDLQLLPQSIGARAPVAFVTNESWTDTTPPPSPGQAFFYRVLGRRCDGSADLP